MNDVPDEVVPDTPESALEPRLGPPMRIVGLLQLPAPQPERRSLVRPVVTVGVLAAVAASAWFGFGGGPDEPAGEAESRPPASTPAGRSTTSRARTVRPRTGSA
jgi:hypothetical protein